jgi:hypothetical protein
MAKRYMVRACNIGSSERHNLRSKELDYIRPELTHRNDQWVERSIPEVHQDIAEKYKATTGQGLQKKATPNLKIFPFPYFQNLCYKVFTHPRFAVEK